MELAAAGLANPLLLVSEEVLGRTPGGRGIDPRAIGVEDPADPIRVARYTAELRTLKHFRELDGDEVRQRASDPLIQGALMVRMGEVHGSVAGAVQTTADVLRAGISCVGMADGIGTVSSSFFMVVRPFRSAEAEVLTFSDGAIVPDPTGDQLAEIAAAACQARRRIVGDTPRVAFLSYSTKGSAQGPSVEKIRRALARFTEMMPDVPADGELQVDAALIEEMSRRKAPGSAVGGAANVLIFPNLDAANIAYKLVQRLAGAEALGPIVQGLARPCCDLSRGASSEDVVNVACITSLLAD